MSYLDKVTEKRQTAAVSAKEQAELQETLKQLRKIQQMTAVSSASAKPTVVLTDQTDLGEKMAAHTRAVTAAIAALNRGEMGKEQLQAVKTVEKALKELEKGQLSAISDVVSAIERLDMNPTIKVNAPAVTVTAPKVDVTPITETLERYFTPESTRIDLSCYRAQDITESGDKQYVGFVNPEGQWYIIENDTKKNQLRYVFGATDYATHFKEASSYVYRLLNEAVNAL